MRRTRVSDYRFLFVALLAMALAAPLLGPRLYSMGALEASFGLVLIAAVMGSRASRRQTLFMLALGGITIGSMLSDRWFGIGLPPVVDHLLAAAFLLLTTAHVLRSVLTSRAIGSREIAGVLAVYLLLGLAWAELYGIAMEIDPASIRFPASDAGLAAGALDSTGQVSQPIAYFSFVTLTTLGYGDIVPVAPMARTLAWMEALLGQMYLAVVLARLVSLYTGTGPQAESGS